MNKSLDGILLECEKNNRLSFDAGNIQIISCNRSLKNYANVYMHEFKTEYIIIFQLGVRLLTVLQ